MGADAKCVAGNPSGGDPAGYDCQYGDAGGPGKYPPGCELGGNASVNANHGEKPQLPPVARNNEEQQTHDQGNAGGDESGNSRRTQAEVIRLQGTAAGYEPGAEGYRNDHPCQQRQPPGY